MKKVKTLGLMMVLSLGLTGNILATGSVTAAAPGLLSYVVGQMMSIFANDSCPVRQCQDCRPNNGTSDNGDPHCRPPQ